MTISLECLSSCCRILRVQQQKANSASRKIQQTTPRKKILYYQSSCTYPIANPRKKFQKVMPSNQTQAFLLKSFNKTMKTKRMTKRKNKRMNLSVCLPIHSYTLRFLLCLSQLNHCCVIMRKEMRIKR